MKEENITYKKKKVSIYDMLQIILYLILPFLFIINEYLFIFAIVLKSIFQIIHYKFRYKILKFFRKAAVRVLKSKHFQDISSKAYKTSAAFAEFQLIFFLHSP